MLDRVIRPGLFLLIEFFVSHNPTDKGMRGIKPKYTQRLFRGSYGLMAKVHAKVILAWVSTIERNPITNRDKLRIRVFHDLCSFHEFHLFLNLNHFIVKEEA